MRYHWLCIAFGLVAWSAALTAAASPANSKPTWDRISKAFDQYVAKLPNHHPQALITQDEIEPLWKHLALAGWKLPDDERSSLIKRIPTKSEFVVRQLRTTSGRRFMQSVAVQYPEVYDRLDLLSRTAGGGRSAASGIIAAPDARLTVKYMFSKAGQRSWDALLPNHKAFNEPTGRIYTAEALKKELQASFDSAR